MTQGDILVAAPPELPRSASTGLLVRLLPVIVSIAALGVMGVAFSRGRRLPGARRCSRSR